MARRFLSIFSLIYILALSGCSYRCDFVVINMSAAPIAVQYRLKNWTPVAPGNPVNVDVPAKVWVDEFNEAKYKWRELQREDYLFDKATGTFLVNVSPKEVLLVDHGTNCGASEIRNRLASLKISGASGTIELEGKQAQAQFKIDDSKKYVIRYW